MTEIVRELVDSVNRVVEDEAVSLRVAREILRDFGGQQHYFPTLWNGLREENEAAIYERYDGTNLRAVCREFGVSFPVVYRALQAEMARRGSGAHKRLPPEPKSP